MLITRITAQLRTRNLESTIRFYVDKVGFTLDFRYRDFYAGLSAGDQVVHLKLVDEPDPSIAYVQAEGHFHLYLQTGNVDEVAARLTAHGVTLQQEPEDTEWGTRELVFLDDQGHTIHVGQPHAAAAPAT